MEEEKNSMQDICPNCREKQWSQVDKNYLKLFPNCWSCDNEKCKKGLITLEDFEEREQIASSNTYD